MNDLTEKRTNWSAIKEKLKQKFGMLTESDMMFAEGRQEEMLCRLQTKLGRTKEEVYQIIAQL